MRLSLQHALMCCTAMGAILAGFPSAPAKAQETPQNITQQVQNQVDVNLPSLSPLVDRVMAAVVNVSVDMGPAAAAPIADQVPQGSESSGNQSLDEMLRRFFEQYGHSPRDGSQGEHGAELMALGSGFIIDPSGYIVTNNHVVANAERITIILQDNSRHPARSIGRDEKTDLALLKIDAPKPLPFLQWGRSGQAKVGDWVVAVGNPFGLGGTVTAGIVSARGRDIGDGPYDRFLQIDAPINRGNSGGPTFNLHGEVIGINTAIFSPSGGSVGIGFAIPSDFARGVVDQLKTTGHVERGWLGVSIQSLTPAIAGAFGVDSSNPTGALVDDVLPGSPAAKAGLKRGDIIEAVNGQAIESADDLPRVVVQDKIGQTIQLAVRRDGKKETVEATIALQPASQQLADADSGGEGTSTPQQPQAEAFGIALQPLTPNLRKQLHAGRSTTGVVVEGLLPGSPAAKLGLQPGDIIQSVNRDSVDSPEEAETKLKGAVASGNVVLFVDRNGSGQFVGINNK